ncbi:tetratricopeptide repeat protein [Mobilitalea sibirica]|uniref:Tetratricopeptide repeat protein n=1 Tax=Mobilitalea sibirica TaxID=1462919 RepID=A0A8J7KZ58_9FIRM|nr:tetratricopeptide repeat protein [Mobilitalea sibirica]MBH1939438.1 tetratricopeptide repeat protein [Mobilitalea sibirica]
MKKKLLSFGLLCIMVMILSGCSAAGGYYRSGKRCFLSGNFEEAAANFKAAISQNPNKAIYYIDYGMTLIALGQYEESIEQFDKAYLDKDIIMVKENNKRSLRGKGIAYYQMYRYHDAIQLFDEALQMRVLSELNMDILYYKGSSLMTIGFYEEARDIYTEFLNTFGDDPVALCNRAYTFRKLGDQEASLIDYDKAISLNPKSYEGYFGKYYLLLDTGKEAEAKQVLEAAAAIEVKSKEDRFMQAKVHYYQERYDEALAELSEAFANGFTEAYFYIGEIYRKKKDYETAIYYYDKYLDEGNITTPFVYNQIATSLMTTGEYKQAIKYLEKGMDYKHAGTMKALKKNEIIAYENLGLFETAIQKLKEYKASYPEDKEAEKELDFITTRLMNPDDIKKGQ